MPDIFISYSHIDNQPVSGEEKGWITHFEKNLGIEVKRLMGRAENDRLWIDFRLKGSDEVTPEIEKRLSETHALIILLSNSWLESEWCKRELTIFSQNLRDIDGRIYVVALDEISKEAKPLILHDLCTYPFWRETDKNNKCPLGYPVPQLKDSAYYDRLVDLATDLAAALKDREQKASVQAAKATIYVAPVNDSLYEQRARLISQLQQFGIDVLPRNNEGIGNMDDTLAQCSHFVQLLDTFWTMGIPVEQYKTAEKTGKPILQWRDLKVDYTDIQVRNEQKRLLTGKTVIAAPLSEFISFVRETVLPKLKSKNDGALNPQKNMEQILIEMIETYFKNSTYKLDGNDIFIHPLNDEEIYRTIKGPNGVSKVEDYIHQKGLNTVINAISQIRKTIKNHPMNPNKDYEPLKYFVSSDLVIMQFNNFLKNIKNNGENKKIIYIGDKGSGKTITQNCWLHKNNKELESNKIFWVRRDVAKLYRIWFDDSSGVHDITYLNAYLQECVNIETYLLIQLLYVFCKNLDDSDFFRRIYNDLEEKNIKYDYKNSRKGQSTIEKEVTAGLIEVLKQIRQEEGHKEPTPYDSCAIKVMSRSQKISNTHKQEWHNWLRLATALKEFILLNGYKIINIVDGIDNIELFDEINFIYYSKLIEQVHYLMVGKSETNVYLFMVMRPDTYSDVRRVSQASHEAHETLCDYQKIQHEPVDFNTVTLQRNIYLKKRLMSIPRDVQEKDDYLKLFLVVFEKTFGLKENSTDLNSSYNKNIRLFLHEKLSLSFQIYYRCLQKATPSTIEPYEYASIYNLMSPRNKILAGRLYLNSYHDANNEYELGRYMNNIFYFDKKKLGHYKKTKTKSIWPGLYSLRVIQTLKHTNFNSKADITQYLQDNFDYPETLTAFALNRLSSYGLIRSVFDEDDKSIYYEPTTKWEHVESLIFSKYDILYYLALDTPLPSTYINNGFIIAHSNLLSDKDKINLAYHTNYISASFITVFHFINFICEIDKNERQHINDDYINKKFVLPLYINRHKEIYSRGLSLYKSANNEERNIIDIHFNNDSLEKYPLDKYMQIN